MKSIRSILLAAACAGLVSFGTPAPAAVEAAHPLTLRQFQQITSVPAHPCGWRVQVMGEPGAQYEVYVTLPGEGPSRLTAGQLPTGGNFTTAISAPGCRVEGPWARARVDSLSSAPVVVEVEFF